jgi:hypothetical protein
VSSTLRDLSCGRCHQVKLTNMGVHCECGGDFVDGKVSAGAPELRKKMVLYKRVAEHYELPLLKELVETIS